MAWRKRTRARSTTCSRARGVSRRDFLKYCGSVAAMLGLTETAVPQIAAAVEKAAQARSLPCGWLDGGLCTGCTESMAQVDYAGRRHVVLDLLSIELLGDRSWPLPARPPRRPTNDTVASKGKLHRRLRGLRHDGLRRQHPAHRRQARHSSTSRRSARNAAAIVAVGSCAVDGGWVAADPNPADGHGRHRVPEGEGHRDAGHQPADLPGEPRVDRRDGRRRPHPAAKGLPTSSSTTSAVRSSSSARRSTTTARAAVTSRTASSSTSSARAEEAMGYCLYKVGCKGPQTFTNCPIVRWNRRASWCVESGSPVHRLRQPQLGRRRRAVPRPAPRDIRSGHRRTSSRTRSASVVGARRRGRLSSTASA